MNIDYGKNYDFKTHVKILMPSILTMIFVNFYSAIDSFFIGRFVGSTPMASVTITLPLINLTWGIGVMLAVGSSSYVSIKLGEKKNDEANEMFTKMSAFILIVGIIMSTFLVFNLKPIIRLLGASDALFNDAYIYGLFLCASAPILLFKLFFEYYVRVDGRSDLSFVMSIIGVIFNIILDYLLVVVFDYGVLGASIATVISILASTLVGLYYFTLGKSKLKFKKPRKYKGFIINSIFNGSSEMFSEFSGAFVILVFNRIMFSFLGEDGIASFSIVMNIYYIIIAIFIGISFGTQPIISYNYGSNNLDVIDSSIKKSGKLIFYLSIFTAIITMFFSYHIASLFVGDSTNVINLASNGLQIFSFVFLTAGFNIFISTIYTSIGNGKVSALLSILRSFVFVIIMSFILPKFIGVSGIWLSIPFSEALTIAVSLYYFKKFKSQISVNR